MISPLVPLHPQQQRGQYRAIYPPNVPVLFLLSTDSHPNLSCAVLQHLILCVTDVYSQRPLARLLAIGVSFAALQLPRCVIQNIHLISIRLWLAICQIFLLLLSLATTHLRTGRCPPCRPREIRWIPINILIPWCVLQRTMSRALSSLNWELWFFPIQRILPIRDYIFIHSCLFHMASIIFLLVDIERQRFILLILPRMFTRSMIGWILRITFDRSRWTIFPVWGFNVFTVSRLSGKFVFLTF